MVGRPAILIKEEAQTIFVQGQQIINVLSVDTPITVQQIAGT
jgi:hypothetical protein